MENNVPSAINDFPLTRKKKLHTVAGKTFVIIDDDFVRALNLDDSTVVEQRMEVDGISMKIVRRQNFLNE